MRIGLPRQTPFQMSVSSTKPHGSPRGRHSTSGNRRRFSRLPRESLVRATSPQSLGARIIAIADPADGPAWEGDAGLAIVARLAEISPDSILICAGPTHREMVERGVRDLGCSRERLFGSAPEALAAAVRALVALEAGGSPRDVSLTVVGVPPSHAIVPWENVTVAGLSLERMLSEPVRRQLAARVAPLWPPGAYAMAVAGVKAVTGIIGKTSGLVCCFVSLDEGAGRRSRAVALPVRLGAAGIVASKRRC